MNIETFYKAIRKDTDPEQLGENVSSHTAHYLKAFQRKEILYWNWTAFLFSPIWMLYRGLYAPYVLLMVGSMFLSYLPEPFFINIVLCIAIGLYGDIMYMYFVKKAIAGSETMNPGSVPLVVLIGIHTLIAFCLVMLNCWFFDAL